MATKKGPEGAKPRDGEGAMDVEDVEGHGARRDEVGAVPIDEPGTGPQDATRRVTEGEDDVEGHNFGHNAALSRNAAQTRERDVQRNLKQHDLKSEARRPFFKRGS